MRSLLFFTTSALLSCSTLQAPVTVNDQDLYYLKGSPSIPASFPNYGVEMHFLTSGQSDFTKDSWDSISQGKVCMELSAFDDFNKEISDLCSQVPCDYKLLQAVHVLIDQLKTEQMTLATP